MTKFTFDFDLTENILCGLVPTQLSALSSQVKSTYFRGSTFTIMDGNELGYGCPTPLPTLAPTTPPTPKPSQSPTPEPTKECSFGTYFDEVTNGLNSISTTQTTTVAHSDYLTDAHACSLVIGQRVHAVPQGDIWRQNRRGELYGVWSWKGVH